MIKEIKSIADLLNHLKRIEKAKNIQEIYEVGDFLVELEQFIKSTESYSEAMTLDFFDEASVEIYIQLARIHRHLMKIKFGVFGLSQFKRVDQNMYQLFYRGHGSSKYKLEPKVFRNDKHFQEEHYLYKEIQVRNADRFLTGSGRLELLTTMQHYGLPTRLLDMSASPLVALYFAVSSNENENGELIVFHIPQREIKYFDSDTVEILTALSSLTLLEKLDLAQLSLQMIRAYAKEIIDLNNCESDEALIKKEVYDKHLHLIQEYNRKSIVKKLNNEVEKEYGIHLGEINPFDLFSIVPVQPKQTNERIIRQQGAFIAYGLMGKKVARKLTERYMYKQKSGFLQNIITNENKTDVLRYIIPAKKKIDILSELESLGINAATIYPELDKVADYLQSKL